jgi:hypothetical protein
MKEGHRAEQKIDALLGMIRDDGASPADNLPPAQYLDALSGIDVGRADEVRAAHAEGRGPPDSPSRRRGPK